MSAFLEKAETNPSTSAITTFAVVARIPTVRDIFPPSISLARISLPMESVPRTAPIPGPFSTLNMSIAFGFTL